MRHKQQFEKRHKQQFEKRHTAAIDPVTTAYPVYTHENNDNSGQPPS